ncbi:MAG: hypothetical protein NTX71_04775 [Candidatus Aureabacteria bacterium]|nr:hypothetical protein [Candidatus Auribacterota bacterium]
MKQQLHKRVPMGTVKALLVEYQGGRISRQETCNYLEISKSRFYELYRRYLNTRDGSKEFYLYTARRKPNRELGRQDQDFLHSELQFIRSLPPNERKFNFEVIAEEAHKKLEHRIHRNSIRRFALRHGYYVLPQEKVAKPYRQFEMGSIGMMYQHDDSQHIWIPRLGEELSLIATVDDHSRLIVKGTLVEHGGAWEHMVHAEAVCRKYGLPAIWYLDQHSIFTFKFKNKSVHRSQTMGVEGETQFSMMMAALGIHLWFAPTARAKGKIENKFKYLQARVPYLCSKRKAAKIPEGQEVVEEVINYYNTERIHDETGEIPLKRWNQALLDDRCQLRPVPEKTDWDHVSAFKCPRTVDGYGTLSYRGNKYKLHSARNVHVTVCEKPGEKLSIYIGEEKVATFYTQR